MVSDLVKVDKKFFGEQKATTSSLTVADVFNKEHSKVLRDIYELKEKVESQFWITNFKEAKYKVRGVEYPMYVLTRDGFTILAMGYTGKEAMKFKQVYIKRFNEMEQFILSRELSKVEFPLLTESIKENHNPAMSYHYSNEIDMINRIVLGKSSKQFTEENKVENVRDNLTADEIYYIRRLQAIDTGFCYAIPDFQERKKKLSEYYYKLKQEKETLKLGVNENE